MVDFRPFRGIRYQSSRAGALDHLICPPYDIISPSHERELQERSPYNMVSLELSEASDLAGPDRYARAQGHYRQWLAEGVLQRDTEVRRLERAEGGRSLHGWDCAREQGRRGREGE